MEKHWFPFSIIAWNSKSFVYKSPNSFFSPTCPIGLHITALAIGDRMTIYSLNCRPSNFCNWITPQNAWHILDKDYQGFSILPPSNMNSLDYWLKKKIIPLFMGRCFHEIPQINILLLFKRQCITREPLELGQDQLPGIWQVCQHWHTRWISGS